MKWMKIQMNSTNDWTPLIAFDGKSTNLHGSPSSVDIRVTLKTCLLFHICLLLKHLTHFLNGHVFRFPLYLCTCYLLPVPKKPSFTPLQLCTAILTLHHVFFHVSLVQSLSQIERKLGAFTSHCPNCLIYNFVLHFIQHKI